MRSSAGPTRSPKVRGSSSVNRSAGRFRGSSSSCISGSARALGQLGERGGLEALEYDVRVRAVEAARPEVRQHRLEDRQPDAVEVLRVLDLDQQRERAGPPHVQDQVEGLDERRDPLLAVVRRTLRPGRPQPLAGPQRADLSEGEVLAEPPGVLRPAADLPGDPAVGELGMVGHVGGGPELVLVPADDLAVRGHHHVDLEGVGAERDRQRVGGQGVLRPVAARAAVRDHDRAGAHDRHPHATQPGPVAGATGPRPCPLEGSGGTRRRPS